MLLSVISLLMVALVAAFWTYQGFFSAMIMFFESAVACMLAFGFHESLHSLWGDSGVMGSIGQPLAMMLIFLLSLLVMRLATDRLVTELVIFPLQLERAGGAVCGFLTGMVLVGTALTAVQMLPVGTSVLGFDRLGVDRNGAPIRKSLLLRPDGFAVGLVEMLSNGRFSGGNPFSEAKPDFLWNLYSVRAGPQREAGQAVPCNCLIVTACWDSPRIDSVEQHGISPTELKRLFTPQEPRSLNKFRVCRVQLEGSAAYPPQSSDIRFRVPQFRLVGPPPGPDGKIPRAEEVYLACGMSDLYLHKGHGLIEIKADQPQRLVAFDSKTDFLINPTVAKAVMKEGNRYIFDVVFEVPTDFEPWFIEFKRGGRAEITKNLFKKEAPGPLGGSASPSKPPKEDKAKQKPKEEKEAKEEQEAKKPEPPPVEVGAPPAGRTHVADAIKERTGVTAELPAVLSNENSYVQKHLRGGKLGEGHFYVEVTDEEIPAASRITEFEIPEGKRMVQVGAEQNMPESLYGKAMNYAASVAAQFFVTTGDGQQFFAVGVYSAAKVGDKYIFEVQYWPQAEVPERSLKEPLKLKPNIMKQANPAERKFGYIFLVDPGVEIVSFSTTSKGQGQSLKISVP